MCLYSFFVLYKKKYLFILPSAPPSAYTLPCLPPPSIPSITLLDIDTLSHTSIHHPGTCPSLSAASRVSMSMYVFSSPPLVHLLTDLRHRSTSNVRSLSRNYSRAPTSMLSTSPISSFIACTGNLFSSRAPKICHKAAGACRVNPISIPPPTLHRTQRLLQSIIPIPVLFRLRNHIP